MAEQAVSAVASAVIGGVTDRVLATVMRKLRSRSDSPAAAHEKLQRLELLVLKLRCAIEVSEKHAIGSASLLEWRDKLRDAAAEGGAVVADFQRRAREQGEAASASASAADGALYFTRSALGGMARRVRDVTRRLFSADEDMKKKLGGALEKMERLVPDITQFLLTLQLEVVSRSPELAGQRRRPGKRRSSPAASTLDDDEIFARTKTSTMSFGSISFSAVDPESEITRLQAPAAEEAEVGETEARMLASQLDWMLRGMVSDIKAADGRDVGGLVWLPEWAALLGEAVERGNAVLQTLRTIGTDVAVQQKKKKKQKQAGGGDHQLEEDGELYSFARTVQRLALNQLFWWEFVVELIADDPSEFIKSVDLDRLHALLRIAKATQLTKREPNRQCQ